LHNFRAKRGSRTLKRIRRIFASAYDETTWRRIQQMAAQRGWYARKNPLELRIGGDIPKFTLMIRHSGEILHGSEYSLTAKEALGILSNTVSRSGEINTR
jgi:hypothetical protein